MNTAFSDDIQQQSGYRNRIINSQADLLQCFATVEGNVAVRKHNGSPFIRELCTLMKEKGITNSSRTSFTAI